MSAFTKKARTTIALLATMIALLLTALPLSTLSMATAQENDELRDLKAQFKRPLDIPFPKDAPYSPQMATLGKMLFFDPRLSGNKDLNCASCHNPSFGYEVPLKTPIGTTKTPLKRQAPTLLNGAWITSFFWDGRAKTLEEQAKGPITADDEMGAKFPVIITRLKAIEEYKHWFATLFPRQGLTKDAILTAIATYERTIVSGWAPFDRWVEGDEQALTAAQKRGFQVFNGQGRCASCHSGWLFSDNQFHDIGLPATDIGRGRFDRDNIFAKFAFKTPNLRNLSHRAPYMHDGSIATLEQVIELYDSGGVKRLSRSPMIVPLNLSDQQKSDLLAFLQSLTAERSNVTMPILPN